MNDPIRILLVDDQFIARMGLHSLIEAHASMRIVADAHNAAEAVALHREHQPDVTLMDLRMPGPSGFEAIREIRGEFPGARILVLSNYEGVEDVRRALDCGAMGYLGKSTDGAQLIEAVEAVHHGRRFLPPAFANALAGRQPSDQLTTREQEVLSLIAAGLSNREIGARLDISENTVRVHVARVLQKLGVEDRTQAVVTGIQRGLIHLD